MGPVNSCQLFKTGMQTCPLVFVFVFIFETPPQSLYDNCRLQASWGGPLLLCIMQHLAVTNSSLAWAAAMFLSIFTNSSLSWGVAAIFIILTSHWSLYSTSWLLVGISTLLFYHMSTLPNSIIHVQQRKKLNAQTFFATAAKYLIIRNFVFRANFAHRHNCECRKYVVVVPRGSSTWCIYSPPLMQASSNIRQWIIIPVRIFLRFCFVSNS